MSFDYGDGDVRKREMSDMSDVISSLKVKRYRGRDRSCSSPQAKSLFKLREPNVYRTTRTNDEIHKSIDFDPVIKELVDTAPMQRLRRIKQLGSAEHVFASADHNRLQHSMGVYHCAARLCSRIKENQPNLKTTDKDVLCVKIAALMHDTGHGPFSHLYEAFRTVVNPRYLSANPELKELYHKYPKVAPNFMHEQSSLAMVDKALEQLGLAIDLDHLDEPLRQIGDGIDRMKMAVLKAGHEDDVLTSRDFIFIKEAIFGMPLPEVVKKTGKRQFIGRTEPYKEWLYDVVNNRHNGLDVDKIDYFARDHRRAFGSGGDIDHVMIEDALVARASCPNPDKCFKSEYCGHDHMHYMICYPEKHVSAALNFFQKRFEMHTKVYTHKTTAAVGFMICDVLSYADPYFRVRAEDKTGNVIELPISLALVNPSCLLELDDGVLAQIKCSRDPNLAKAQKLLRRIGNGERDFYKCGGVLPLDMDEPSDKRIWEMSEVDIQQGMLNIGGYHNNGDDDDKCIAMQAEDFIVEKCSIHHGCKDQNPILRMRFLMREQLCAKLTGPVEDLPEAVQVDERCYLGNTPRVLQQRSIRVYSRDSNESKVGLVNHVFNQWVQRMREICQTTSCDFNHECSDAQAEVNYAAGFATSNILSQETDDEDEDNDDDHDDYDTRTARFMDRSPVPTNRFKIGPTAKFAH